MKYTEDVLREAVTNSQSMAGVLRHLGIKPSGGMHTHLKRRIDSFEIDTSHFKGQGWTGGAKARNRLAPADILVVMPSSSGRQKPYLLRRALVESGVPYRCNKCGVSEWQGEYIILDVDHIDGDWCNNIKENLRFLCPNCHSQTDNFAGKSKRA